MSTAMTLESLIHFLLETPMFGDLTEGELAQIVHILQIQRMRAGQFVFREGDPGGAWYVLHDGQVEVLKDTGLDLRTLATLGPRACFGEMSILDGSRRSATVRALTDGTLLRFPKAAFDALLDDDNLAAYKLVYQMAKVLAARQRRTTSRLAEVVDHEGASAVRPALEPIVDASRIPE
jgi:CRP-like cAMP-binding protein